MRTKVRGIALRLSAAIANEGTTLASAVGIKDIEALGIVDRACRTLKEKIFKLFSASKGSNWIDYLNDIVKFYNKTPHYSLNYISPDDVKDNYKQIYELNILKNKNDDHNYKVGDFVRIKIDKNDFDKGYKQSWSTKVYTIKEIHGLTIILDNNKSININSVQKVSNTKKTFKDDDENINDGDDVEVVDLTAKKNKKLKVEGINNDNILNNKRKKQKINYKV